jgi:hypothetical protein
MKTLQKNLAGYFAPGRRGTGVASRASAASRKTKKLLLAHPSITVEKDAGSFWVFCEAFDPDDETRDPLYDRHYATSWEEVLESVEIYVAAIQAEKCAHV